MVQAVPVKHWSVGNIVSGPVAPRVEKGSAAGGFSAITRLGAAEEGPQAYISAIGSFARTSRAARRPLRPHRRAHEKCSKTHVPDVLLLGGHRRVGAGECESRWR